MQKIFCIFFIKSPIYSVPNAWFLLARQRKIKKVVSKKISDYFIKLVEPLVTTQRLEEMFAKLKEEIIERSE